jgi:hypothetical protein
MHCAINDLDRYNFAPFPRYPFYASRPASQTQAPNIALLQMFVIRPITSFSQICYYNITVFPHPVQH